MKILMARVLDIFGSFGLACVLLLLLGLLTWIGTLEQVNTGLFEVQKKYFESYLLWHDVGLFSIPLPGANLVMSLLFVNLIVGGIVRLRKGWATVGVMIIHIGILMMLTAGFIKAYYSVEGHVTLFEEQTAGSFRSYYQWELAVIEDLGPERVREHIIPHDRLAVAEAPQGALFSTPQLPFDVVVTHLMRNAEPLPKGPMFDVTVPVVDGVFLRHLPPEKEAEANLAGAYVAAVGRDGTRAAGIVWGGERTPWTVTMGGKRFGVSLRRESYPLPFALRLDKFTKEDHPRTMIAKVFSSDVTVSEGSSTRAVKISMNEPMRDEGLVLYQSSWGPSNARPGDRLFSTLAVVRNPADQFPLYSCLVIAAGLLIHFTRKLVRHVRLQGSKT